LTWLIQQANQYHGKIDGTFSKYALQTGSYKFDFVLFMKTKNAASFLSVMQYR